MRKKKKEKVILIEEKKASIIALILSFCGSFVFSFLGAAILLSAGEKYNVFVEKVSITTLAGLLFPILFIIFGTILLVFVVICASVNKKK